MTKYFSIAIFIVATIIIMTLVGYSTCIDDLEQRVEKLEYKLDNIQPEIIHQDVNYMYGEATAYYPPAMGINSDSDPTVTSTGKSAEPGVIAVNPDVIPYGSEVMIIHEGTVIRGQAQDTGGAMMRNPKQVDILVDCLTEAFEWGRREVHIIWW